MYKINTNTEITSDKDERQVYFLTDVLPNLKEENRFDGRRCIISIGNFKNGKFKKVYGPNTYYAARSEHNAVRILIDSIHPSQDAIDELKKQINADILFETPRSIIFSIYGLKTKLPIWY